LKSPTYIDSGGQITYMLGLSVYISGLALFYLHTCILYYIYSKRRSDITNRNNTIAVRLDTNMIQSDKFKLSPVHTR